MDKSIRIINIKFRGIDDWNRPIFKDVDTSNHFGSVSNLFNNDEPKEDIIKFFKEGKGDLEFFGNKFNCEPHGGLAPNVKFNFVDELPPQYVITGILRNGKRFNPIHTNTPQHYNIWQGTLWRLRDGKRKKIKTYYN